jgi:hypothetical protein
MPYNSETTQLAYPNEAFFEKLEVVSSQCIKEGRFVPSPIVHLNNPIRDADTPVPSRIDNTSHVKVQMSMLGTEMWTIELTSSTWLHMSKAPLASPGVTVIDIKCPDYSWVSNGKMLLSALLLHPKSSETLHNIPLEKRQVAFSTLMNEVLHRNKPPSQYDITADVRCILQCMIIAFQLELHEVDKIVVAARQCIEGLLRTIPASGCLLDSASTYDTVYPEALLYTVRQLSNDRDAYTEFMKIHLELTLICSTPEMLRYSDTQAMDKLKKSLQWVNFINYHQDIIDWIGQDKQPTPSVDNLLVTGIKQHEALTMLAPYLPGYNLKV